MNAEDIQDVSDQLFDRTFLAWLPYSATVPKYELRDYGVVGFHDKRQLASYLADPILAKVNIVNMAKILDNGDTISVYRKEDVITIYDIIITHLENWLWVGQNHLASRLPPLKDLAALDNLAASLFSIIDPRQIKTPKLTDLEQLLAMDTNEAINGLEVLKKGYVPYTDKFIELGAPRT